MDMVSRIEPTIDWTFSVWKQSQIRGDFIVLLDHATKAIKGYLTANFGTIYAKVKIFFSNDQESYFRPKILENHRALNFQKISRGLVLCIDKILEYFPSEKAFLSKLSL